MSDDVFDVQILSDKLSKLNSSQQSIESLSRWCIAFRKKAKQIVEIWDKSFNSAQKERVAFLYLANDILQNSRRKGNEFVNEFWKVLPAALKNVFQSGDDHGKKAASRLMDIWEERRVFGSRGQNLKDELLNKDPPASISNGKSSNPIKTVKRDAHSLRIKLSIGGMPEKIVTAYQSVHDVTEEDALDKCKAAVSLLGKMETVVETASSQGNQQGSALLDEMQVQENVLQECIKQLDSAEATRCSLVVLLKAALQEQEVKLELIRTYLRVAQGHIEQMGNMRYRLTSPQGSAPLPTNNVLVEASTTVAEPSFPSTQPTNSPPSLVQPAISLAPSKTREEENKKAAAAAVAAKLAASTSSAQMLTSVLSSLVAEEAASMGGGLKSSAFTAGLPMFSPEKRPKLDNSVAVSDTNNSDMGGTSYFTSLQQQLTSMPLVPPTSLQSLSQANQVQATFPPLPPQPPPVPLANSAANQFVQSAGLMMGAMPYPFGGNGLPPPPPPLPSHMAMGLARPGTQPPQQAQPQSLQVQQPQQPLQPNNGGYYRPPGIGFYGQSHQPSTPPLPRQ